MANVLAELKTDIACPFGFGDIAAFELVREQEAAFARVEDGSSVHQKSTSSLISAKPSFCESTHVRDITLVGAKFTVS